MHELEVEIRNSADLMQHAYLSRGHTQPGAQEWSPFEDTILVLLNNVRLLIRYVTASGPCADLQQCRPTSAAARLGNQQTHRVPLDVLYKYP